MPNRLYLGPDGRFQSAVPRLTHVHTRAHTLAVPRLTRVHTRSSSPSGLPCPNSQSCTHANARRAPTRTRAHTRTLTGPRLARVHTRARVQGPAPAACRPLERCAPGLGRAWSRVPILPTGSRPRTCGTWPSPTLHPASSPPGAGQLHPSGLCAPRPRAGSAGAASRSLLTGPRAPDFRSRFPPSVRGSRGSSGWVSVACGSSRADVLLLVLTTPNVLRRLRPMVSVTAVWRIRGRF